MIKNGSINYGGTKDDMSELPKVCFENEKNRMLYSYRSIIKSVFSCCFACEKYRTERS